MASKSEKPLKTIVKPRFFKDAPLFERYVFLFKTIKIYLKNTVDNDIRSGNDFFSILSRFGTSWRPFWDLLEPLGRPLGSLGRLLGFSWESLGVLLDAFWRPPRLLLALLGPVRRLQHRAWAFLAGFSTRNHSERALKRDFSLRGIFLRCGEFFLVLALSWPALAPLGAFLGVLCRSFDALGPLWIGSDRSCADLGCFWTDFERS